MKRTATYVTLILFAIAAMPFVGCQSTPLTAETREQLHAEVDLAIAAFKEADPSIEEYFDSAHGFAVFPSVGKGGFVVGGAYGRGVAFELGQPVGYSELRQGTVGAQIGGQSYREVIFFENEEAFTRFRRGTFALSAQASAVAARVGAATSADYEQGVVVFVLPHGGLMAEASVGGQQFTFVPIETYAAAQ
jgi:lipid-binding SYLF domain-containing protein